MCRCRRAVPYDAPLALSFGVFLVQGEIDRLFKDCGHVQAKIEERRRTRRSNNRWNAVGDIQDVIV